MGSSRRFCVADAHLNVIPGVNVGFATSISIVAQVFGGFRELIETQEHSRFQKLLDDASCYLFPATEAQPEVLQEIVPEFLPLHLVGIEPR